MYLFHPVQSRQEAVSNYPFIRLTIHSGGGVHVMHCLWLHFPGEQMSKFFQLRSWHLQQVHILRLFRVGCGCGCGCDAMKVGFASVWV